MHQCGIMTLFHKLSDSVAMTVFKKRILVSGGVYMYVCMSSFKSTLKAPGCQQQNK